MNDEAAGPDGTRRHSRDQLLRLLHDDPRAVSRAEIKAAFADGRLGDQDLDIPVLAGMKRITELLSELEPEPEVMGAPTEAPTAPRPGTTAARLIDLDERVGRLESAVDAPPRDPPASASDVADLRATLTRLEAAVATQDARLRQAFGLVAVALAIAVVALVLAIIVR